MKNYYIFSSGTLKRKNNTLYVDLKDKPCKYIPVEDIEVLFLFGEITLNTKLLNFLSKNGIMLHTFNYYGFYSGSFVPRSTNVSGSVVIKQAACHLNSAKRQELAIQFVDGAVGGIIRNLNHHKENPEILERMEKIKTLRQDIHQTTSPAQLMGIEGNIRQHYYACFKYIIKQDLVFTKRTRQPPDNEINALISFLNSLVYSETLSQIYQTQLDPTISFLHEPFERRYSLSLDLAEIFKPFIADRIIFKLLNLKQITAEDFNQESNGVLLNDDARKKVLSEFNNRLNKTVKHRTLKRQVSYKRLIRLECYKLVKHFIEEKQYKAFKVWW